MLRVLSLFSGIGAYEKALRKLNIPFEVIGYCEKFEPTALAYSLIHRIAKDLNYKDVTMINEKDVPDFDLLAYSPPCQAFSITGKRLGFEDERGVLFFDALRIIKEKKPKFCVMENVKNLTGKQFIQEFNEMLLSLEEAGYRNYHSILNSKEHGIPQNRERVFLVSIRKDIPFDFSFPAAIPLNSRIIDLLEDKPDEKYFVTNYSTSSLETIMISEIGEKPSIIKYVVPQIVKVRKYEVDILSLQRVLREHKNMTNKQIAHVLNKPVTMVEHWFRTDKSFSIPDPEIWPSLKALLHIETNEFDESISTFIEKEGVFEKSNRVYDVRGIAPTLTKTNAAERILHNGEIRRLTPLECFRLMGFEDQDYLAIKPHFHESHIYGMAGNSVVVNVLEEIFKNLPLNQKEESA